MEIREIGNTQGGKRTKDGEKWMRLIEGGKPHTPRMQHDEGILAYLTARASTLPLLECEGCGIITKGKAHMTAPLTHLISTECFYFYSFIIHQQIT